MKQAGSQDNRKVVPIVKKKKKCKNPFQCIFRLFLWMFFPPVSIKSKKEAIRIGKNFIIFGPYDII